MKTPKAFQKLIRCAIENRLPISLGLSAACGIVLRSLWPVQTTDPMLQMIAIERPVIYQGLTWSYTLFLYSTPFLVSSILFSLVYVHLYVPDLNQSAGQLPVLPDPRTRRDLFLVVRRGPPAAEAGAVTDSTLAGLAGAWTLHRDRRDQEPSAPAKRRL